MNKEPIFSLILGIINCNTELKICLDSLSDQEFKDFELIVVDQSQNDEVKSMVLSYSDKMNILYNKVNFRGLSKARNYALKIATGKYFALIDDDAEYEKNYFKVAYNLYNTIGSNVIISGNNENNKHVAQYYMYNHTKTGKYLSLYNIFIMCCSPLLIFPMALYKEDNISFDELFGVGTDTCFKACEETDYILSAIDKNYKVIYSREMKINHPSIEIKEDEETILKKKYQYSCGLGGEFAKDYAIRKNSRLGFIKNTTIVKNYIKMTGIFGKEVKRAAIEQSKGFKKGLEEFKRYIKYYE